MKGANMWFRLMAVICLGILLVGGITAARIDNVSAPIRITDDPPPKTKTTIKDNNAAKTKSKTVDQQQGVKAKSQSQTGASTINQK
jgi:hypothetical protein